MRPGRVFYGWWIVAAGFTVEALIGALFFHVYGSYVVMLRAEYGWSKTMLSAAFSMARMEIGILGPIQGWQTDRFGPRAVISIGMTLFALGLVLFSQIGSPLTFFLAFFLVALGSGIGGYLPITVAIVGWFRRRRALALSLAASGMPIGGLLSPAMAFAMTRIGWRWTAFLSGIVILLVGVPVSRLFRHRPEPYGYAPDGLPAEERAPASGAARRTLAAPGADFTAREAMRTPAFWYIATGHAAALLVVSAVVVHLVAHVTERLGYPLEQAATVAALMTVMQVAGQLLGGWAGDTLNKRAIVTACMAAHAVALLLLASATGLGMVVAFAVVHGLAWGIRGPLIAALRADYFGSAKYGTISGFASLVAMIGMIAGPLIAGIVADRTGSYDAGFRLLAALAALGSICFVLARRPSRPAPIDPEVVPPALDIPEDVAPR